mmetsp:Transcript_11103/g.20155  ORF Transcript_11103/g.20155 Transcript_11103/m.20155 type:complete len:401 (-) Transcript_11103:1169-2371(-)
MCCSATQLKPKLLETLTNGWQGCCRNALPNCFEMVVSGVELNATVLRKLRRQNLFGCIQHEVSTCALAHTTKDHHMVDLVELRVLSKCIAQVHAHGFVDLAHRWLLCGISHGLLDQFQALRMIFVLDCAHVWMRVHVVFWHLDSAFCGKLCCATLAQVHVRDAFVGSFGPWISDCLRVQVQPDIAQLIDPAHEIAVFVGIATTLTAAHGDTQDVALANLLYSGERCHFPIIDDLEWDITTDLLGDPAEDVHNLRFVDIGWNVWEDVAPSCLVVAAHCASSAAAHCFYLAVWKRCLGQFQSICNHLEVIVWIGIGHVPLRFFRINDVTILHSNRLDIALAKIKSQSAAIRILSTHLCGICISWKISRRNDADLKGLLRSATDIGHGFSFKFIHSTCTIGCF